MESSVSAASPEMQNGTAKLGPLHHVTVAVPDLERSLRFYRDALGLRATLEMSFDDEGHQVYLGLPLGASGRAVALRSGRAPACGITLCQFDPAPTQAVPPLTTQAGACMFAFELPTPSDVDAVYERVTADGVEAVSAPTWAEIGSFGRIRGVTLRDPDGFLVECYAPEGDTQ
jgi:catechol 2,3-dioxygenase-like lactoylglutathione lyase family enzyme